MADPKGPERQTGGATPAARPKSPTLDLKASDVTPRTADAKATDAKTAAPQTPASGAASATTNPGSTASGGKSAPPATSPTASDNKIDPRPVTSGVGPTAAASSMSSGTPAASSATAQTKPASSTPGSSSSPSSAGAGSSASGAAGSSSAAGAPKPTASAAPWASSTSGAKPSPSVATPQPSGGVGMLGAGVAALVGAAIAIAVVALFGRDLIGAPTPDTSRVTAVETKLDAVANDIAALRQSAGQTPQATDTSAIDARIAELGKAIEGSGARAEALETEIRTIASRPAAVTVDTSANEALSKRVDGLDAALKDAPKASDIAEANAQVTEVIEGLRSRIDTSIETSLKPLTDKIAALESELKARPVGDPGARLVVALGALDQALAAGRPFANELAAAKAAGGEVAGLDSVAAAGLPTDAALASELEAIMAGLPPLRVSENASVFERFVANAGSIVKVTPKDAPAGVGPAAVRQRVGAKAASGDVAGALTERDALDDAAKAATEAWAQKAQSRIAAEKGLADARSAALARLGSN